ncbi:MAG: sulfatase-like hydrolase/transferase [Planctomycetaceae bacterium]|nr:sulfatase-like hydrolase/transferase [Planctomycetaceae bacterium]
MPITRHLLTLLLFTSLFCLGRFEKAVATEQIKRPNILFIYTDDHSYRSIGCYPGSHPWVRTPNIDRLAKEGMRFDAAYIGTWCMPSRATQLTGRHQFGIESMRMQGKYPGSEYDPEQTPFWPKTFREQGYFTGQIGKWHTGTDTGFGRDWDYQLVWNRPKYTGTAGHYYYDQPVTFHGGETKEIKRYSTDQYTDWAIEFLNGDGRDTSKPWYLWLCYGAVHGPYTPAERHLEEYQNVDIPVPVDIFPPRPGKPDWASKFGVWKKEKDGFPYIKDRSYYDQVQQYHQAVRAIDEGVGRLIKTLEETGQRENTLIVFTSDQGFAWGQHGFRHKLAGYDANIRSPLIVSQPGRIPAGTVCRTPVSGVDLPPTFFSQAGLDVPATMHGHDLSPLLKDPEAQWNHPAMIANTWQYFGSDTNIPPADGLGGQGIPWYVMLREGKYKYIRSLIPGELEELYNLESDPEELTNLAQEQDQSTRLKEMRKATLAELKRTEAGFVERMPAVGDLE